jgi:hypothetical protein
MKCLSLQKASWNRVMGNWNRRRERESLKESWDLRKKSLRGS